MIRFPASATLDAAVHYGALDPSSITFNWILDDGPAVATFGNGTNEDTTVSVPLPGRYTFELIAIPEAGPSRSGRVTVTFLDTYAAWAAREFEDADAPAAGQLADADADGLANMIEFVLDLDPGEVGDGSALAPFLSPEGFLTMVYFRRYLPEWIKVIPEASSDLISWDSGPAAVLETVLSVTDEGEWIQASDLFPYNAEEPRFMRVRVDWLE